MKKSDPSFEWKLPIEFYGRVVDESGNPVPQATVRYGWNDVAGSHEQHTATDDSGTFRIHGLKGKILSVDVTKLGYHSSATDRHSFEFAAFFEPDYYRPNPEAPVVFHLTKKLEAEPLISHHNSQSIAYNAPAYYDLGTGKLSAQSSAPVALKFTVQRAPSPIGQPYGWNLQVESTSALLQPISDEFGQLAPETGYQKSWNRAVDAGQFEASLRARLYIQTTDGRYGRVNISLSNPNSPQSGPRLTIDSFLNPTPGSRNLEFDPKKQIVAGNSRRARISKFGASLSAIGRTRRGEVLGIWCLVIDGYRQFCRRFIALSQTTSCR